ncbi:MAG: histidinol dehydrogenase [Treponema sp.]|jgi:histidinol dehydrogenase|nr:histidinol dehydrogenase [Treponema sp.]
MRIIGAADFDTYWKNEIPAACDSQTAGLVSEIIEAVRNNGDRAVRDYAARFDRTSPENLEVPLETARAAHEELYRFEPELADALELSAGHLRRFAALQSAQLVGFETELDEGLFAGQRIIPVERAAVYVPAGRFPLVSSALMGLVPAFAAGAGEVLLVSPPLEDGVPCRRILAAAVIAAGKELARLRIFAMGGAQAIAALALGTQSVPRASVIAGPGNRYVAEAKRSLFGETGIDFIAGPTDVLILVDGELDGELAAADLLAQAEHDPDARARALLASVRDAETLRAAVERRLALLGEPSRRTARASLDTGGLAVVYRSREEAARIANLIAPEHLELHTENAGEWLPLLKNYGSLFIGKLAAEVLGDYSAGINHTLPTSGSSRFTGGLSARHFLKVVTTLRCNPGPGFEKARRAAELIGRAEGLAAHAESAASRVLP